MGGRQQYKGYANKGYGGSKNSGKGWAVPNSWEQKGGKGYAGAYQWTGGKNQWQEPGEEWQAEEEGTTEHTNRIWSRYQFPKAILRASAGKAGSCFVKSDKQPTSDDHFLESKNLKTLVTNESSHMVRRPGVGTSEVSGTIVAGMEMLKALLDTDQEELLKLLGGTDGEIYKAFQVLNTVPGEEREEAELTAAFEVIAEFFQKHEDELHELAANLTISSGRLYLMGTSLLQLGLCLNATTWWAANIPESITEKKSLSKWKAKPKDFSKMVAAITSLMMEKAERDSNASASNSAADLLKRKVKKSKRSKSEESEVSRKRAKSKESDASQDSSSDDKKTKKKKDATKKKKKVNKKGKKGKKHSDSSSDSEAELKGYADWPLKEFQTFLQEAQIEANAKDMAQMEAEKLIEIIEKVPVPLREIAGLPKTTAAARVLAANAEKASKKITTFVEEVAKAHVACAENFNSAKHEYGIDDTMEGFGLLKMLVSETGYLTNEDVIKKLFEAYEKTESKPNEDALESAQKAAICNQVVDYGSALTLFAAAEIFATKFGSGPEPKIDDVREFTSLVKDEPLRKALGMTSLQKYDKAKIKPKTWKADISKQLTLAYLGLTAHHEDWQDVGR